MRSTSVSSFISKIGLLLKPLKKRAISSSFILIFQGVTEGVGLLLIIPLLSMVGVDNLLQTSSNISSFINRSFNYFNLSLSLLNVLIIYLLIICFYAVLKYFQNINTAIINKKITTEWRFHFFKLLSNAPWSKIQTLKTSTLHEVLTSEVRKLGSVGTQLVQLFSALVVVIIYFTLSLLLSVKLTALAIVPVGILLFLNKPLNKMSYTLGQSLIRHNQTLYKTIEEHLAAIKLVKIYNKGDQQSAKFKETSDEVEALQLQFVRTNNRTRLIFELIAAIAIASYVYFALSYQVIPVSELLLLLFIFVRLFPKIGNIASSYQNILNIVPSFEAVQESIEQLKVEVPTRSSNRMAIDYHDSIDFENVDFYYGNKLVLSKLSFSIPFRQTTAITGFSGAGKSTVVDLILGLQQAQKGHVKIGQHSLNDVDLIDWRDKIAYVPQDPFLFNGTIKDNLLWVKPTATNEELWSALEQASASKFVKKLPLQMDTLTGNRGTQLSGGERQRIALARALLVQPQLLILDEATSAIDDVNEQIIKEVLKKMHHKITVIIVAHRSTLTDLADHTIQL